MTRNLKVGGKRMQCRETKSLVISLSLFALVELNSTLL